MLPLKIRSLILFIAILWTSVAYSQRRQLEPFDILNYKFDVALNDSTDVVSVNAEITLVYSSEIPAYTILDLASSNGKTGMQVSELKLDRNNVKFTHATDQLKISTPASIQKGDTSKISISYSGVPDSGLIISQNLHGDRVFFAEHWPNRAHRWLSVIDHPAEKATCMYIVTAPARYKVVANGDLQSEVALSPSLKKTTWKMKQPISAKVMVIGVAEFETRQMDDDGKITVWAYKKSGEKVFDEFAKASSIFNVLEDLMGEYPFTKCDQVESTTRFGGMENAGNIFYPEKLLTGEQKMNKTIAHEIGHQYFGNTVTEADWEDIWISEGFATYLEYYWAQKTYSKEDFQLKLKKEEKGIIDYQRKYPKRTVIQKDIKKLDDLMNKLTYDKSAWALRMLKQKVGAETFRQIIITFYQRYKFSIASTQDFIEVANEVSLLDLTQFFQQWFYKPGTPSVTYNWKYKKKKLILEFEQETDQIYDLDIEVQVKYENMNFEIKHMALKKREQTFRIACDRPSAIVIDPLNIILGDFRKR